LLWNTTGKREWLESNGPLISPVLSASTWDVSTVSMDKGDQLLLYTDGVSEVIADTNECVQTRIETLTGEQALEGKQLLEAILSAVHNDLAGRPQPDDLTLLTARVLDAPPSQNLVKSVVFRA
jgi:serine phosphatase RsbU (regulator of sigma subunit)